MTKSKFRQNARGRSYFKKQQAIPINHIINA